MGSFMEALVEHWSMGLYESQGQAAPAPGTPGAWLPGALRPRPFPEVFQGSRLDLYVVSCCFEAIQIQRRMHIRIHIHVHMHEYIYIYV